VSVYAGTAPLTRRPIRLKSTVKTEQRHGQWIGGWRGAEQVRPDRDRDRGCRCGGHADGRRARHGRRGRVRQRLDIGGAGEWPTTFTEATVNVLDPVGPLYAAIGTGDLRAYVQGQDDVCHAALSN
jgi:hypothetical protein